MIEEPSSFLVFLSGMCFGFLIDWLVRKKESKTIAIDISHLEISTALRGCRHCGRLPRHALVNNTCEDCIEQGAKYL